MPQKIIEFITFDENYVPQYNGCCKLVINRVKKVLIIESKNELKKITASIQWHFMREKNILFIFADDKSEDCILVFDKKIRCKKVFGLIFGKKMDNFVEKSQILKERFLSRFSRNETNYGTSNMKKIIEKWIENNKNDKNGIKESETSAKELNSKLKCDLSNFENAVIDDSKRDYINFRKRKYKDTEISKSHENFENRIDETENGQEIPSKKQKLFFAPEYSKTLEKSNFKLVTSKDSYNCHRRCLIIFLSAEKKHCYEYFWNVCQHVFYCSGCRIKQKNNTAKMEGFECVKIEEKEHDCDPILYDPQKFMDVKIVQRSDFEIIEDCDAQGSKYLFILSSTDRNQCHEFKWNKSGKKFECFECKNVMAKTWISSSSEEEEYVELYNTVNGEHNCKTTKYNPEKYFQINQYVLRPNFELRNFIKDGIQKSMLIIFTSKDQNLCYYYSQHSNYGEKYFCRGCNSAKSLDVTATIFQNSDGVDYVILSNVAHICTPKRYIKEAKEIHIYPPKFKFMDSKEFHLPKLFIFDDNNPNLCYTFTLQNFGPRNKYYCISCDFRKRKTNEKSLKSMDGRDIKGVVNIELCKNDESGEYFVKMFDNQRHICKPKKYAPEKYMIKKELTFGPSEFFLFYYKEKPSIINAAIYDTKTQKKCYIFRCTTRSKSFVCIACQKLKNFVSARCYTNLEQGNEYFKVKSTPHVCTPINVSSLKSSKITVLKESGLNLMEQQKIDESKIIRKPNFELRNPDTLERKLFVFCGKEKRLCYEFSYSKFRNHYRCLGCSRKGLWVKATLKIDENGENYFIMGERKHECEPIKYETEISNILTNDFLLLNKESVDNSMKLVVFTSPLRELCYIYRQNGTIFQCVDCKKSRKLISAKLCTSEDGKEYVKLFKTDHICTPQKYDPLKIDTKIIPESEFQLFDGLKGQPNMKLIIFDSKKEGHVYEFKMKAKSSYICVQCSKKKQITTAKLFENENGQKFVRLETEHCCNSVKFDPENFTQKKTIYDNFVLLPSTYEGNKKLVIFDAENDNKYCGYEYFFQKYCSTFLCRGCSLIAKVTPVRAKLKIDKNGKQFVEIGIRKHSCSAKNFMKENRIVQSSEYKYLEAEKKTIVMNHSKNKSLCYKLIYDEKLDAFCCLKCKEKKISAVIAKDKNGEEFLLLNKPHICTPLSKSFIFC